MKKLIFGLFNLSLLCWFFPSTLYAADNSSFTFAPPIGDFSIVFLGNIFGIVDGVLHGTGSQIMGTMFGVFNSAVLALGGIIIMYTLLVSTMNTAHEGELLGRKWSSIWVPMRSTLGLALLIPKASGYCLMQIFVMWIVVQGVGAADKIWNAALSYLNRGGTIVQKQLSTANSLSKLMNMGGEGQIADGAAKILAGQVCMVGLQTILTNERETYLKGKQKNAGACSGSPSAAMQQFCETPVPDFLSSVNASIAKSPLKMPNFPEGSPYHFLNGICGEIKWLPFTEANNLKFVKLTDEEKAITSKTRDAAVQEMYSNLSGIAQRMVANSPLINTKNPALSAIKGHPINALEQFGIPLNDSNKFCADKENCIGWGSDTSFPTAPLFQGTEFQSAIAVYNATMRQSLSLVQQDDTQKDAVDSRAFIKEASQQGWIMAGSYFFKLVQLNASNSAPTETIDSKSGLAGSAFSTNSLTTSFTEKGCVGDYSNLCIWLKNNSSQLNSLSGLIDGSNIGGDTVTLQLPQPNSLPGSSNFKPQNGQASSTVIGFLNNSMVLKLPDQPGQTPPKFIFKLNLDFTPDIPAMKQRTNSCAYTWSTWYKCLAQDIVDQLYNFIIVRLVNGIVFGITAATETVVYAIMILPLMALTVVFQNGVEHLQQPNVNPIVSLASMGIYYINTAIKIWIYATLNSIAVIIWPWVGIIVVPIIALATPIFFAWVGVMMGVGYITAYYIPFVPYMIFTFGTIAWLMAVIEAMVAAPIVALGVTHPEGEGAFGKGEQAIMILFNVFLRPAMMIIGYIAAIALTYVSVWIINAGFSNVLAFLQGTSPDHLSFTLKNEEFSDMPGMEREKKMDAVRGSYLVDKEKGYIGWAGAFGFFFSIIMYTMLYLTVVQKSFTLITNLPDRILRWISGGSSEQIGAEVAGWGEESKQQVSKTGEATSAAQGQAQSKLSGMAMDRAQKHSGGKGQVTGNAGPPTNPAPAPNAGPGEGGRPGPGPRAGVEGDGGAGPDAGPRSE